MAQSLNAQAYDRNPGFRRFVESSGLSFRPHDHFKKADLDARQILYGTLAELVWSPDRIVDVAVLDGGGSPT